MKNIFIFLLSIFALNSHSQVYPIIGKVFAFDCDSGISVFNFSTSALGSVELNIWGSPSFPQMNLKLINFSIQDNQVSYTYLNQDSNQTTNATSQVADGVLKAIDVSVDGKPTVKNGFLVSNNNPAVERKQCGPTTVAYKFVYSNLKQQKN